MGDQVQPTPQFRFGGVVVSGHALDRPADTAVKCENLRVMPGFWLRLRSGRKARMYHADDDSRFRQFLEFRNPLFPGYQYHAVQFYDGTAVKWKWLDLDLWDFNPFFEETISQSYDNNFARNNAVAACRVRDKIIVYNGLGVRDTTNSRPPFTSFDSSSPRYVGLDAYHPNGSPAVAFASNAAYYCSVISRRKFYVGVHNTATGHYSNGVLAGEITTNAGPGRFEFTGLLQLKIATHGASEQNELKYVFYATLDGDAYQVPYMVMNAAGDGPYTVAVTQDTANLNFIEYQSLGGIFMDVTQEMPSENFPPRPMRSIAYVNGRVYGALSGSGTGSGKDFKYNPDSRLLAGVVYSAAASDLVERDFVGNPEESFPLANFTPTPNSERPFRVAEAPSSLRAASRVLVITPNASFLVEEASDGLHEWKTVSPLHGMAKSEAYAGETPYGSIWVTQRNQVVVLPKDSDDLILLSRDYQPLLSDKVIRFCYYILDPLNEVDQFRIVLDDGTCVVHDFAIGGQGYTMTVHDYTAAATLKKGDGTLAHVAGKRHLYTHEGQPGEFAGVGKGEIVTYDEDYTGPTTKQKSDFTGVWMGQWDPFGDSNLRKELPHLDVIGDDSLTVDWYADLEGVQEGNRKRAQVSKVPQATTDETYRHKFVNHSRKWYKFAFTLPGNYSKGDAYQQPNDQADMKRSAYGAVLRALRTISGIGGNRP